MATIPSGTKFLGVNPALTNLTEKKGTALDSKTEYFSIEDIQAAAESKIKAIQVNITQAEILNASGFSKSLVSAVTGKVLVPISLSVYRKSGGTVYSIANSVRLATVSGAGSGTLGSVVDSSFTSATVGLLLNNYSFTSNANVIAGNSLVLVSGSTSSPSVITGGTGDLIAFITYTEVDTTL
jgi:hypothetical protein